MSILIATTVAPFVMEHEYAWASWLNNAEAIIDSVEDEVTFFVALEIDARGIQVYEPLALRLGELERGGTRPITDAWTFSVDDLASEITTENRLLRITMGQNLANRYGERNGHSHMLFCAADCEPPADVLPRMLEMNHPICAPEITTYCLPGDMTTRYGVPVRLGMASAACIFLARSIFVKVPWRTDGDEGWSDDPSLWHDCLDRGIETIVRQDCFAKHYPEAIGPMETRYRDRRVRR